MDKTLDPQTKDLHDSVSDSLTYVYRPRMMSADYAFRLAPQTLKWDIGRRSGEIYYRDIARVRYGYSPGNLASSRFVTEVWSRDGLKLLIVSVSARSLFDFENRGRVYRDFVTELSRRIAAADTGCSFEAGFPNWRWWPATIAGITALLATIYLCARALLSGELAMAAALAAFGLFFCWQVGSMIIRNRPRIFVPPAIPQDVLPSD